MVIMIVDTKTKEVLSFLKYLKLEAIVILLILTVSKAEKLVIKSYDSKGCMHVSLKNVSVQPCVWKEHNSTKRPYSLTQELLSIHPFEIQDDQSSSSEEANPSPNSGGNQSYYLIRIRQATCLLALDDSVTTGKCRYKRARFLIRSSRTRDRSSFKFTIETPSGKCLSWDETGTELAQTSCLIQDVHKMWIFCTEEGDCGMDPSHPMLLPVKHVNQTITAPASPVVTLITPVPMLVSSTLKPTVSGTKMTPTKPTVEEPSTSYIASQPSATVLSRNESSSSTTERVTDTPTSTSTSMATQIKSNGKGLGIIVNLLVFILATRVIN